MQSSWCFTNQSKVFDMMPTETSYFYLIHNFIFPGFQFVLVKNFNTFNNPGFNHKVIDLIKLIAVRGFADTELLRRNTKTSKISLKQITSSFKDYFAKVISKYIGNSYCICNPVFISIYFFLSMHSYYIIQLRL